jgi:N-ethylmaleimide reductase
MKRIVGSMDIFSPISLLPYQLPNRMFMAPMTRSRAGVGNVPTALNATYYAQRSSAGLIVNEATQISLQCVGSPSTPEIHSAEQVAGWKQVTQAFHGKGGRIFLQLWHVGRISHPSMQPDGVLPVAPSTVRPEGAVHTPDGASPFVTPRALELAEIRVVVDDYGHAAETALAAGFDGVELDGANGCLLDQFLRDKTNQRADRYGGSIANRARLLLEAVEAVTGVWGVSRVGVRSQRSLIGPAAHYAKADPPDHGGDRWHMLSVLR